MKLPEINEHMEICVRDEATSVEIIQLHCLRSIAVNLECIASILGVVDNVLNKETYNELLGVLDHHSVAEIFKDTPDDEEDKQ